MTIKTSHGFTLIEVAVVLIILGLVLGGFLMPLGAQIENGKRSDTKNQLEQINEAILGFAMSNNRLPCPDTDNDGLENRQGSNNQCQANRGTVAYATLATDTVDAWGQAYIYHVTGNFADTQAGTGCASTSVPSFSLCSNGDIEVRNSASGDVVADNLPVIVLSRGKNWATSTSTDESENNDTDAIYVQRLYSNDPANSYDDLVSWLSPNILKNRMVSAGRLP